MIQEKTLEDEIKELTKLIGEKTILYQMIITNGELAGKSLLEIVHFLTHAALPNSDELEKSKRQEIPEKIGLSFFVTDAVPKTALILFYREIELFRKHCAKFSREAVNKVVTQLINDIINESLLSFPQEKTIP